MKMEIKGEIKIPARSRDNLINIDDSCTGFAINSKR